MFPLAEGKLPEQPMMDMVSDLHQPRHVLTLGVVGVQSRPIVVTHECLQRDIIPDFLPDVGKCRSESPKVLPLLQY